MAVVLGAAVEAAASLEVQKPRYGVTTLSWLWLCGIIVAVAGGNAIVERIRVEAPIRIEAEAAFKVGS